LAYISVVESIRISSTTFTQSAQKATKFGEITQPFSLLRRSRSFEVTEFGTNRKPICDFLLVINSNLPPILHRFRDIAWDDLHKILPGCRQVTNVLNGAETLPKISIG